MVNNNNSNIEGFITFVIHEEQAIEDAKFIYGGFCFNSLKEIIVLNYIIINIYKIITL